MLAEKSPNLSTLTVFNNVLLSSHYKEREVIDNFTKLVDKKDYRGVSKDLVLGYSLTLIPTNKKPLKIRTSKS